MLKLNTLSPAEGSKKSRKRVGRGAASGWGKTCGKGNKGQKSRSGGGVRAGFEGGQMPLQMRLPKFGFTSRISSVTQSIRLSELNKCEPGDITFEVLVENGLVRKNMKRARIFLSGSVTNAYNISEIAVTKGAKEMIEKAGGKVS
jgi:large subunit ribosomal protein L15